jgi:hypothetical protein
MSGPCASHAVPADPADSLPGPLKAYALAVREAGILCQREKAEADHRLQIAVAEAFDVCEIAMGRKVPAEQ